jgi:hypothetical protein
MFGLNDSEDYNFLKLKRLIQICISQYQVILRFDDDISISVESAIRYKNRQGNYYTYEDNKLIGSDFISLIGNKIHSIDCENSNILKLSFDTKEVIELINDSEAYESFNIFVDGKTIVI